MDSKSSSAAAIGIQERNILRAQYTGYVLCMLLPILFFWPRAAYAATTVNIVLSQPWTDTGISVKSGQLLTVNATGTMNWATGGCPAQGACEATPDGKPWSFCSTYPATFSAPGLSCFSLVGKIGVEGNPFEVGSHWESTIRSSGQLFLGVNDANFPDNTGSWVATIESSAAAGRTSTVVAVPSPTMQRQPKAHTIDQERILNDSEASRTAPDRLELCDRGNEGSLHCITCDLSGTVYKCRSAEDELAADLSVSRFDTGGIVLERTETSGRFRGLTATYTAKWSRNPIFIANEAWTRADGLHGYNLAVFGTPQAMASFPKINLNGVWNWRAKGSQDSREVRIIQFGEDIKITEGADHELGASEPYSSDEVLDFIGQYKNNRIVGRDQAYKEKGPISFTVVNPDFLSADGAVLLRDSMPNADDAPCDQQNSSKTMAWYALLRGKAALQIPDDKRALCWFRIGADGGEEGSQARLALMLCPTHGVEMEWGGFLRPPQGVKEDCAEAVRWSRLSAAQTDFIAASSLAYYYRMGRGVAADASEAALWKQKSDRFVGDNSDELKPAAAAEHLNALINAGMQAAGNAVLNGFLNNCTASSERDPASPCYHYR